MGFWIELDKLLEVCFGDNEECCLRGSDGIAMVDMIFESGFLSELLSRVDSGIDGSTDEGFFFFILDIIIMDQFILGDEMD